MSNTQTTTEVNRYGNVFKVTSEILEVSIDEVRIGDRILEGPGWSSHGMKEGFWTLVDEADNVETLRDYHGDTVTIARTIRRSQIA